MLCPVLISRDAELHALQAALERAREGAGGVLILAGDAGVGKSRLATELATQAGEQGIDVLRGRATESVVPVPFRPITEALMKVARTGVIPDAPEMASYRPALGSLVPEWSRPEDGEAEISPLILGEALIRLLTSPLAPPGPPDAKGIVLILEDVHWADPETLAILEYLADNLGGTRVLCVATLRDSEPSAGLDCVRALNARRAVALVEVRRLMDWAVREMAAACLGTQDVPAGRHRTAGRLRRAAVRGRGDSRGRGVLRGTDQRPHRVGGQRPGQHRRARFDRRIGPAPARRPRPAGRGSARLRGRARQAVRLDAAARHGGRSRDRRARANCSGPSTCSSSSRSSPATICSGSGTA